jgi:tetratricopeptide (TPR) repeat protein
MISVSALVLTMAALLFPVAVAAQDSNLFAEAVAAARADDHRQAVSIYSRIIDEGLLTGTTLAYAYHNRAGSRRRLGESEGAVADYTSAIQLMPESPYAHYGRGSIRNEMGRYEAAIEDFDVVLDSDPDAVYARYSRAHALHLKGDMAGALDDYAEVIRRQPDHAYAHFGRGNALHTLGRRREAVRDFRAAYRLAPEDPSIRGRLSELGLIE